MKKLMGSIAAFATALTLLVSVGVTPPKGGQPDPKEEENPGVSPCADDWCDGTSRH